MSFSSSNDNDEVMGEINMTPLVDVMLVLLIVFIITVPVMNHSIQVNLPQASTQREEIQPDTLRLAVDAAGDYNLNGNPVTAEELPAVLQAEAQREPPPALHISGDKAVRYEHVAKAMAMAQQAGLKKIGFVTEPIKK
jgi:biopolymer transport protein ExbD